MSILTTPPQKFTISSFNDNSILDDTCPIVVVPAKIATGLRLVAPYAYPSFVFTSPIVISASGYTILKDKPVASHTFSRVLVPVFLTSPHITLPAIVSLESLRELLSIPTTFSLSPVTFLQETLPVSLIVSLIIIPLTLIILIPVTSPQLIVPVTVFKSNPYTKFLSLPR